MRGVAHLVVHGIVLTSSEMTSPVPHWRPLDACCRPWTWWYNDATALAGYAAMMMNFLKETRPPFLMLKCGLSISM